MSLVCYGYDHSPEYRMVDCSPVELVMLIFNPKLCFIFVAAESSLFIWCLLVLDVKLIHIINREMDLFADNPWQGNPLLKCWLKLNGKNEDGVRHPSTELENDVEKTGS